MKLNRHTLIWAWITAASLLTSHGVTLNDGTTTSGLVRLSNENGADITTLSLSTLDRGGESVILSTQMDGGDQSFAVRTVWYPSYLNLTGAVYTIQADYQPASSTASEQVDQLGGIMGWLNLESKIGISWYVQPGDSFFDPALQLRTVRFSADNAFDNESLEGLFHLDGSPATFTTGSANADIGTYTPTDNATFILSFSVPTAADLAALPEATSRVKAMVTQGVDNEGNPIPVGDTIEMLTTLQVPEGSSHKAGYFGYYGNIFSRGTLDVGFFDNLIADGQIGEINRPPSVIITSPQGGSELDAPANTIITATAEDSDNSIILVEFLVDGQSIGSDVEAPYAVEWNESTPGDYTLTARAIDELGAEGISDPVAVTILRTPNQAPQVVITSPTEGAVLSDASPIVIQAEASDPDGSIDRVEFFDGGILVGSDDTEPYELDNSFFRLPRAHTVTAVAFDDEGDSTESAPVNYTVTRNTAPEVNVVFPNTGASFVAPATIMVQVAASDDGGTVVQVDILLNNEVVTTDTEAPFTALIEDLSTGSYTLMARATDNFGAVTTSPVVNISVRENQLPGVLMTSPASGAMLDFGQTVSLQVSTNDPDGEVVRVDYFDNLELIGSSTESPFDISYTPSLPGNRSLTAVATDNDGGTSESLPVVIEVNAPPVSEAPVLNYSVVDGQLEVSWDPAYLGSVLEQSMEIPGVWSDVVGSSTMTRALFPLDSTQRYFRLRAVITLPPPTGDAPTMAFTREPDGTLLISWDATGSPGFVLQNATQMGQSEWVTLEPTSPGSHVITTDGTQMYFRLVKP